MDKAADAERIELLFIGLVVRWIKGKPDLSGAWLPLDGVEWRNRAAAAEVQPAAARGDLWLYPWKRGRSLEVNATPGSVWSFGRGDKAGQVKVDGRPAGFWPVREDVAQLYAAHKTAQRQADAWKTGTGEDIPQEYLEPFRKVYGRLTPAQRVQFVAWLVQEVTK